MGNGTFTVRRDRVFWLVRAGDVVVHQARSKPEAVAWAASRSSSVYVQNLAGKLVRYVGDSVEALDPGFHGAPNVRPAGVGVTR